MAGYTLTRIVGLGPCYRNHFSYGLDCFFYVFVVVDC